MNRESEVRSQPEISTACPSVSVIIPVYNGERFLLEALDSVLRQNYQPLELLVVDDGSSDQSAALAATLPDVRVLRKEHSGLAATLNYGLAHANGELFAFLDADDRWLPGKLLRQVTELLDRSECDAVFAYVRQFAFMVESGTGREVFSPAQPAIHKSAMLIRRSSFLRAGSFSEESDRHDFLDWYARAALLGLQSYVIPEVLVERRIHDRNTGIQNTEIKYQRFLHTLRAALSQRRQVATDKVPASETT
jgi:glycosyltransferase involved in cell wall biosynthesis